MNKYGKSAAREAESLALELANELNYLADELAMDSRENLYESPDETYTEVMQRLSVHFEELGGILSVYTKRYKQLDTEVA